MGKINALRAAVVAAVLSAGAAAQAAVPSGAEAAITGYSTDTVTVIGYMIAAGIAIFGAKKLGQKMGWL